METITHLVKMQRSCDQGAWPQLMRLRFLLLKLGEHDNHQKMCCEIVSAGNNKEVYPW